MCALFHDVGEVLNHVNHGEIGESDADDGRMSKDSGGGKEGLVIVQIILEINLQLQVCSDLISQSRTTGSSSIMRL